jgi:diguanylate cyclase (GGDEF)-like protein
VNNELVTLRLGHDSPASCEPSEADVLRRSLDHALATLADQRAQIAALVAIVRETVATVAGERATFHDTLTASAERFERIAVVDDLQHIQAQLIQEVTTLKQVTLERHTAWQEMFQDFGHRVSTLEAQLDHTRREAALDPLTNVANRRTLERTCREWLEPHRPGFVMAIVDVDDFKAINDQHGHAVGDRVLITVAETLGHCLRAGDLVARVGGDEFAVLGAGLTLQQAEARLAVIGRSVQDACRPLIADGTAPSISIGVAERSAGDTFESLQERADAALYQAKRNGKRRVAARATPLIRDLLQRGAARSRS